VGEGEKGEKAFKWILKGFQRQKGFSMEFKWPFSRQNGKKAFQWTFTVNPGYSGRRSSSGCISPST